MNSIIKVSPHFTLDEVTHSQTADRLGLDNTPSEEVLVTCKKVAGKMEVVRALLNNKPIIISSWYRSPQVNKAVGGVAASQHTKGEAVDFICPSYGTCAEVAKELAENVDLLRFDQLILEHSWVHISFAFYPNKPARGKVLSLLKSGKYALGLTDNMGKPYAK